MATLMPSEFDAATQFKIRVARGEGKTQRGLALLDKVEVTSLGFWQAIALDPRVQHQ